MKVSIAELLLLVNQKTKEISENYYDVVGSIYVMKDRELDGKETILNEVQDFNTVMDKYEKSINELTTYKNALNNANATVRTASGMTIYEAINYINSLRKKNELFETLSNKKPKLSREFDGVGSSSYYKVSELTYDPDSFKTLKRTISTSISTLEADIANTNATHYIEV